VLQEHGRRAVADQTARPPDHQEHHGEAEHQHAETGSRPRNSSKPPIMASAASATPSLRSHAAEHDDRQHQRRFLEGEDSGLMNPCGGEERAGETAEHGAGGERRHLVVVM